MVAGMVGESEGPSISQCIISISAATHFLTPPPLSKFLSVVKLDKSCNNSQQHNNKEKTNNV